MSQAYSDPKRASDLYALPNVEVFHMDAAATVDACLERGEHQHERRSYCLACNALSGWYWQACFPGCLPDGDPVGPFETEAEALADAQEGSEDA